MGRPARSDLPDEPDHSTYGFMTSDILHAYMGLLVLEDYLIERKSYV
jgi:hypothetical protein